MNAITIGSFFNELEKISSAIGSAIGNVEKSVAKVMHKPGITMPLPVLKAKGLGGTAASRSAPTSAGRAVRAAVPEGTAAGVVPKSLGAPSGSLTGTHVRPGTQVSPRVPGQGSTRISTPKPAMQAGAASGSPAVPSRAPSPPPGASKKRGGLMSTLALGGGALGAGAMLGHAMPQQQQQAAY